jgi:hypothetical protein
MTSFTIANEAELNAAIETIDAGSGDSPPGTDLHVHSVGIDRQVLDRDFARVDKQPALVVLAGRARRRSRRS